MTPNADCFPLVINVAAPPPPAPAPSGGGGMLSGLGGMVMQGKMLDILEELTQHCERRDNVWMEILWGPFSNCSACDLAFFIQVWRWVPDRHWVTALWTLCLAPATPNQRPPPRLHRRLSRRMRPATSRPRPLPTAWLTRTARWRHASSTLMRCSSAGSISTTSSRHRNASILRSDGRKAH